jgi:NAD(P)-dependent dehydrogenase (short-subunit alcohol dehydrogenase family)
MKLQDKNIVITGAANGIGLALANRFISESPNSISLIDINNSVKDIAAELKIDGYVADVSDETSFQSVKNHIIDKNKSIDLFSSNAGIQQFGTLSTSTKDWQRNWDVNVMSQFLCQSLVEVDKVPNCWIPAFEEKRSIDLFLSMI